MDDITNTGQPHDRTGPHGADQHVDARGLTCPLPLLKTRQALRHMAAGQLLEVRASDTASARDIPGYLGPSVHELVRQQHTEMADGAMEYRFLIRCGAETAGC